nr:hypothetical protein [uncultured Flavobacterium sp.]
MNVDKYKYHFRPEYNSENLLIEIFSGVENEKFLSDLLNSIIEINPKIEGITDLWMNDEFIFEVHSDSGNFLLSKDIWDLAFIMSENNQECVHKINSILLKDKRFEKVEVNFDDYK